MTEPDFAGLRELKQLLPTFSDEQFAAFSVLCAERHRAVFESFFFGTDDRELREGVVQILWDAALGNSVDIQECERLRGCVEALVEELNESDDTGYPMACCDVLSKSLARLAPRDWDSDGGVAVSGLDVAQTSGASDYDAALNEESDWQVATARAIARAPRLSRDEILALQTEPEWVAEFKTNMRIP